MLINFTQIKYGIILLMTILLTGCASHFSPSNPTFSKEEIEEFEEAHFPYSDEQLFTNALKNLKQFINRKENKEQYVVMVKPFGNKTGSGDIPQNLTMMVQGSVLELAGKNLKVKIFDPVMDQYEIKAKAKADLYIAGAITRYDKSIVKIKNDKDGDLLVGGGTGETDIGASFYNQKTVSSVANVIFFEEVNRGFGVEGMVIKNQSDLFELSRENEIGFVVNGSGIGLQGSIEKRKGLHQAVQNMLDYSILQLFSRLYKYPYWWDFDESQADPHILNSLKRTFAKYSYKKQVRIVQGLLALHDLKVVNKKTGKIYKKIGIDGGMGTQTKDYITAFYKKYNIEKSSNKFDLIEIYGKLREFTDPRN